MLTGCEHNNYMADLFKKISAKTPKTLGIFPDVNDLGFNCNTQLENK